MKLDPGLSKLSTGLTPRNVQQVFQFCDQLRTDEDPRCENMCIDINLLYNVYMHYFRGFSSQRLRITSVALVLFLVMGEGYATLPLLNPDGFNLLKSYPIK